MSRVLVTISPWFPLLRYVVGVRAQGAGRVDGAGFTELWGPDALPSSYLASLIEHGHVCLPKLNAPEICVSPQQWPVLFRMLTLPALRR